MLTKKSLPLAFLIGFFLFQPGPSAAESMADQAGWKQMTRMIYINDPKEVQSFDLTAAQAFGDEAIVCCKTFKRIDESAAALVPFSIKGATHVHSIYDSGHGLLCALCSTDNGVVIKTLARILGVTSRCQARFIRHQANGGSFRMATE